MNPFSTDDIDSWLDVKKGGLNWLWKPTCSDGTIGIHPRLL